MRYFLIKSYSEENVTTAYQNSCWATSEKNGIKFSNALDQGPVTLIFSVNGSSKFCGYATMINKPGDSIKVDIFKAPDGNLFKWKIFDINWLCYAHVNFSQTENILNSLNFNKPLKIGRDGQEIDHIAAQQLINLFACDNHTQPLLSHVNASPKELTKDNNKENSHNPLNINIKNFDSNKRIYASINSLKLAVNCNPTLAIFPIDLTNLSYEQYIELYQKSGEYENPPVEVSETN